MNRLFISCFHGCLRGDDNHEYYDVLEVNKRATTEEIKKAYKKISLETHPDRLQQRGITPTAEHKARFLKVSRKK